MKTRSEAKQKKQEANGGKRKPRKTGEIVEKRGKISKMQKENLLANSLERLFWYLNHGF